MEQPMMSESTNVFSLGDLKFEAYGDRVLIQEDEFKSGYECPSCSGSGNLPCSNCAGAGVVRSKFKCSHCEGSGVVRCEACGGKGGLIAVPEISQRRPTTGKIVSAGVNCKMVRVGESVMYSNFAGYVVDLNRSGKNIVIRILHENEVLCRMEGHLELRTLRNKTEVTLGGNL